MVFVTVGDGSHLKDGSIVTASSRRSIPAYTQAACESDQMPKLMKQSTKHANSGQTYGTLQSLLHCILMRPGLHLNEHTAQPTDMPE